MSKTYLAAAILSASVALSPAARAQSNPSADDLIKSLKPTAQSLKTSETRGLHRMGTSDTATDPAPVAAPAAVRPVHTTVASAATPPVSTTSAAPAASLYVQFPSGSAELTPQATAALDELGRALSSSALAGYRFRIEGHTDTVGSKEHNQALSERRAAAVVAYIEKKFGIEASRLTSVGLGSEDLLVPTPDQTPEARNRRVQVVNLGA